MERPGEFTKCPCCANPWSGGENAGAWAGLGAAGGASARRACAVRLTKSAALHAGYSMVCEPCKATAPATAGISFEDFDEMVAPNENFYEFAIGAREIAQNQHVVVVESGHSKGRGRTLCR